MVWRAPTLSVATVFWALSVASADAKTVLYEINGQRFSYSTKNRAQVQIARERINAANAAAAARAKANAELAANPLVRVFGSQTENEAKAAEARLSGVLARARSTPELSQVRRGSVTAISRSSTQMTHATRDVPPATGHAAPPTSRNASIHHPVARRAGAMMTGSVREPRPEANLPTTSSRIEAVVFDFASNIKTVHRADGSVEEDTFEPTAAAELQRARRSDGPAIRFVNDPSNLAAYATGEN